MRCIQCNRDNKLKDRRAYFGQPSRCSKCKHPFVFEPTSMKDVNFTDPFFAKAIADISANNTLFFTPKQFLYFLDKRIKNKALPHSFLIFLYVFFSVWTTSFIGSIFSLLLQKSVHLLVLILFNLYCFATKLKYFFL
jgi:hypothetical protein